MSEENRIVELRTLLHRYNHLYYVDASPEVSDFEFDSLMRELQELESRHPELHDPNSPTQRVGSDLQGGFEQTPHKYPMLSLDNTYSIPEVEAFFNRVGSTLGEPFEICCELKFDGLSISLIYSEGKLVQAVTRGDGVRGDVVTQNVRTIRSVPLVLQGEGYPKEFEIRGEVLLPWEQFEKLNAEREREEEPLFANPRNAASGTLKLQNTAEVARRGLDSYLYYLLGENLPGESHYDNMQSAAGWGFKVSRDMKVCSNLAEVEQFIEYWDVERKRLPVATDGIVLKVNSIRQQQILGYKAKSPRWAIAYKFQAERALTRLDSVSYQVGRTGAVTPVANLAPVQLSGTVVRRASLHNADIISSLDLHLADLVWVEKGGEIIPKITGVDTDSRFFLGSPVGFAKVCPECGTPLVRYEGEAAHYCPNSAGCPPQIKGRIEHFVSRKAMNISGVGPETIDMLYELGKIHDITDLYALKVEDLNSLEGMGQKSAEKLVASVDSSRQVPFERVLFAIGIRFVGETVAKILARHFRSMDALMAADFERLKAVPEIGCTIARSLTDFFSQEKNISMIERLRGLGLNLSLSDKEGAEKERGKVLSGKSIVISGVFQKHTREEYKSMIESYGGKNSSSISKKTSFVLAGENMGPSKMEKAESLGVKLMNEDEFLNMIEQDNSKMERISFTGLGVALVTPFDEKNRVDFERLGGIIEYLIENGTDYLCVLGTTAETPTLTKEERSAIVRFVVEKVKGRVPIMVGCGSNNTAVLVETLKTFDFSGVQAVLSSVPYYNKPSQEGIYQHFKAVAEASPLPVVLYNIPGRTGVNMTAQTTLRLAGEFSNITGVKEASGNLSQMEEIAASMPEGFSLISGDDSLAIDVIRMGGAGVISVVGNALPLTFSNLVHAARKHDYETAESIQAELKPLYELLFREGNPCGIKDLMATKGLLENRLRLPLVPVSGETHELIALNSARIEK